MKSAHVISLLAVLVGATAFSAARPVAQWDVIPCQRIKEPFKAGAVVFYDKPFYVEFTVNGKKVNIPSYLIKAGDVIAVRENKKDNKYFTAIKETKATNSLKWVEFDREKLEGKVLALPTREEIDSQIAEHMIVELYSK